MALIDDLIGEVPDARLQARLRTEADALRQQARFGINFERHSPEFLVIPGARVRQGAKVAVRGAASSDWLTVESVNGDIAICRADIGPESQEFRVSDLVVVKRHGEPVFPAFRHIDSVSRGGTAPHHLVIEGENYSSLQLLKWLYEGRVTCIYIDPPYNNGEKTWKYNNNFVDKNDTFMSSKWLSWMERRLMMAKDLLAPDGVMVIAIDDNEFAHLRSLLNSSRLFRRWEHSVAVVQHNRKGGGGGQISRTHEYAIFLVPPGSKLHPITTGEDEKRDYRRRGSDPRNHRRARKRSFFAIHVHPQTREVVGIGPELEVDDPYETGPTDDGLLRIYPLGENNLERVWRNSRETALQKVRDGRLRCNENGTVYDLIDGQTKKVPVYSVWEGPRYNAGEQGTNLVKKLTGSEFPYPKSLYTVADCLKAALGNKKDALILDFFGGSGTTLHAVALMNEIDGGSRRAILVTNNEVGPQEEDNLRQAGLQPGDPAWEEKGICRSVTWPRVRNAVLGQQNDGSPLEPKLVYQTGEVGTVEQRIEILPLTFTTPELLASRAARTALAGALGLPAETLASTQKFYVPVSGRGKTGNLAVLLDPQAKDEFLAAIDDDPDHIEKVRFVPPSTPLAARVLQQELKAALPAVARAVERTRLMSDGLEANVDYLRLDFLDPLDVARGQGLPDLVPALWAMAGAVGELPSIAGSEPWVMPEGGRWALLVQRRQFRAFRAELGMRPEIEWAFLVAPSTDAFSEMAESLPAQIPTQQRVHLHRRYLDNFLINGGVL